jgi:hypothetical protein
MVVELDILVIKSLTSAIPRLKWWFLSSCVRSELVLFISDACSYREHETMSDCYRLWSYSIPTPIIQLNISNWIAVILYQQSISITFQFYPPYEHEYIGKIERAKRTSQKKISCALAISAIPDKHSWVYAANAAILKLNLIPRKQVDCVSPYQTLHGRPYDFEVAPTWHMGNPALSLGGTNTSNFLQKKSPYI